MVKNAPYSPPECFFMPDHPNYPSLVDSPNYEIKRIDQVSENGRTTLKVSFQYRDPDPKKPTIVGWLVLDPSMNWVIQNYEYTHDKIIKNGSKSSLHYSGSVHYQQVNGVAVPTEIEYTKTQTTGRRFELCNNYTLSEFALTATPSREFTLAAFGLGDVERTLSTVRTRKTYETVGLTALALGAFAIGVLLYRKGRAIQKGRIKGSEAGSLGGPPEGLASEHSS